MKIMVCGYARHGKDTVSELLGLSFESSSQAALFHVIWPALKHEYDTPSDCFADRANRRDEWAKLITNYNNPDKTRLARQIFRDNDVYCGIRNASEFMEAKKQGLFNLSIWVDASDRHPPESVSSCTMNPSMCDIIIDNNGTIFELKAKVMRLARMLQTETETESEPVRDLIVGWANAVFPQRTITNAIHKMVLEEIPEYLLSQHDELELADLGILLYDIAHLAGVDLESAIRKKMAINIARQWKMDPETGLMNHVEE